MKSTDGGKSFVRIYEHQGKYVPAIALSPGYPSDPVLYFCVGNVANRSTIMRSTDAGVTWEDIGGSLATDREGHLIVLSPGFVRDRTAYVGCESGLYRSRDAGDHWEPCSPFVEAENSFVETIALSPDFASDKTMMVGVKGGGIHVSQDGGDQFTPLPADTPAFTKVWYYSPPDVLQIANGKDGERFLVGINGQELFLSRDGGQSWHPTTFTETARTRGHASRKSLACPITIGVAAVAVIALPCRQEAGSSFRTILVVAVQQILCQRGATALLCHQRCREPNTPHR